jgi:hypothetical protein
MSKFHSHWLEFDFPFSDLSSYIFPFRKPQVVLITATMIIVNLKNHQALKRI